MKKTGLVIKLISSTLIIILGLTIMVMGILGQTGGYFYGSYTSYEQYGGDAYTGIQNAVADTSDNIRGLGNMFERIVKRAYILIGILLMVLGVYMLGCTLNNTMGKKSTDDTTTTDVILAPRKDIITTITKFKELLDAGAITQEEFEAKKKDLLGI